MPEPMPPTVSVAAHRMYGRLPRAHRAYDASQNWVLKRYVDALCVVTDDVRDLVDRLGGDQPIGPAAPLPTDLPSDELERWSAARQSAPSALGDPMTADAAWLPWLAQLVGTVLSPSATEAEQRDTIRYTTSGWRAGTVSAIADAARSALTGSKFCEVRQRTTVVGGNLEPGTMWDVTLVTRTTETPDVDAVLDAVIVKGVKPAGVVLHHLAYSSTWADIQTAFPTWADLNGRTWTEIHEAGLG